MARGDVIRVNLPPPPGSTGREQTGQRPAIAVQAGAAGANLPTVMIVPTTGQLSAARFAYTFGVDLSTANGLTVPSVVLVFQLRAIDRQRVIETIGRLEKGYLDQLDSMLRHLLGL